MVLLHTRVKELEEVERDGMEAIVDRPHDSLDGALDVVDAGAERPAPAPPPAARTRGTAASPPPG